MGLAIALFGLFLLVLTALTFAVVRLFAGKDSAGRHDPASCLVGCAVGVGLLAIGVMGLIALVGALVVVTGARAVKSFPVEKVYVGTEPEQLQNQERLGSESGEAGEGDESLPRTPLFESDPARPLHVVFEIDGHLQVPSRMEEWIDDWSDHEARVQIAERTASDGRTVTWVDVALPAEWRDLREIEREVRKLFPEAGWAGGLHIEFKSVGRDW